MKYSIGASQINHLDIGVSQTYTADLFPVGSCSAEATMTGLAIADIVITAGEFNAEASMLGIPELTTSIIGDMSATATMTGNLTIAELITAGTMSCTASMYGTAVASLVALRLVKRLVAIGTNNSGQGQLWYEDA